MRAHFAGDVVTSTAPAAATAAAASIESSEGDGKECTLEERIMDFKRDSKNMEVLAEFIDEVLQKAEAEATKKQMAKNATKQAQPKEKSRQSFTIPDFKNGKVVNRARGLVVRIFDAICNCANTATAPATRIKLRGKRSASTVGNSTHPSDLNVDKPDVKEKSKKQENGKEKKNDKKKKIEQDQQEEQEQALLKDKSASENQNEIVKE